MRVTLLCETLKCLPHTGGLFDQDELHLRRMEIVLQLRSETEDDRHKIAEMKKKNHGTTSK